MFTTKQSYDKRFYNGSNGSGLFSTLLSILEKQTPDGNSKLNMKPKLIIHYANILRLYAYSLHGIDALSILSSCSSSSYIHFLVHVKISKWSYARITYVVENPEENSSTCSTKRLWNSILQNSENNSITKLVMCACLKVVKQDYSNII